LHFYKNSLYSFAKLSNVKFVDLIGSKNMRLSFPLITRSDETFLFALYSTTRADEMALVPWNEEQKDAFVQSQFQAQQNHYFSEYPNGKFQTVSLDDQKIGRLYICESEDEIHIIDLTILPEFRGQGIGTQIITDILQTAEKPVQIYLESFNQSINLFTRLGFQIIKDEGIYHLWECQVSEDLKTQSLGK
jgi:ribosomal protein S18 acetylase RimI-like enzyme